MIEFVITTCLKLIGCTSKREIDNVVRFLRATQVLVVEPRININMQCYLYHVLSIILPSLYLVSPYPNIRTATRSAKSSDLLVKGSFWTLGQKLRLKCQPFEALGITLICHNIVQ
jgi:hypothetical protein